MSYQAYDDEPAAVQIAKAIPVAALAAGHIDDLVAATDVTAAVRARSPPPTRVMTTHRSTSILLRPMS